MNKKNNKTVLTYNGRLLAGRPVAGQKRYVAAKRTALDGKTWWCIFDHDKQTYISGCRYTTRTECESWINLKINKGYLPVALSDYAGVVASSHFKKGKHTFAVDVNWNVARSYEVEAESREEAARIIQERINAGEVCVWTDGFETTDDVEVRCSGEETAEGEVEYF